MVRSPKRLTVGEQLAGIPVDTWNSFCDLVEQLPPGVLPPSIPDKRTYGHAIPVQVRNGSGSDLTRGGVLGLDDSAFDTSVSANLAAIFAHEPVLDGVTPTTAYEQKFCVLLEPIGDGKSGPCAIAGVVWAWADVTDSSHTHCGLKSGDATKLSSGTEGAPIIWKETGTGTKRVLINLSQPAPTQETAKIVSVNDTLKPSYQDASSPYDFYMPAGTASSYSRDASTGKLTDNADSITVVNGAQRMWAATHPRTERALAVPIGNGEYVMVPMATDPFVPVMEITYTGNALSPMTLIAYDTSTASPKWLMDDNFTITTWERTTPSDSEYRVPFYARPTNRGIFLMKPGKYVVLFQVGFDVSEAGGPAEQNTGSAAGHVHTYELQPSINLECDAVVNDIDVSAPGVSLSTQLRAMQFGSSVHMNVVLSSSKLLNVCGFKQVNVEGGEKPKRLNLLARATSYYVDGVTWPEANVLFGQMIVIPVSDYIQNTTAMSASNKRLDTYNPYSSGSFVWYQGYSNPINWDESGT